ncbi:hypothetical protein FA95DRAFT_1578797, partial [Auriscalpium vulgare]
MDKANASQEPFSSSQASPELNKSLIFSHSTRPFLTADETFQPVEPIRRSTAGHLDSSTEALAMLDIDTSDDNWHIGRDAAGPLPYPIQPMPPPPPLNTSPTPHHPMTQPSASVDSASSAPARDRVRAPRMTLDERCCTALDTITVRRRGGIETLLLHVFGPTASEQTRKHAERFFSDSEKMSAVLDCWYESPEGREVMQSWMKKHAVEYVKGVVDDEMTTIAAKFQLKLADATPEHLLNFRVDTHVYDVLDSKAPVILSLLKRAMQSDRAAQENTLKRPDTMAAVLAAMMVKHRSQNAQLFACPAGLSLWAAGAPRQVIDILSQLGFSTEYSSIRIARAAVSKRAMELASQTARKRHLLG